LQGRRDPGGGAVSDESGNGSMREGAPEISGFLSRGSWISVSARIGNDLTGYVCDSDGNGLLLEVRDPSGALHGY
jgi:hypothetical protein